MSVEKIFDVIPAALLLSSMNISVAQQRIEQLINERFVIPLENTFVISPEREEVTLWNTWVKQKVKSFLDLAECFDFLASKYGLNNINILIKAGVYNTTPITIGRAKNIFILGEGIGRTIIRLRAGYENYNVLFIYPDAENVCLKNLTLDWNRQAQAQPYATESRNLRVWYAKNMIIDSVELVNGPYASLQLVNTENFILSRMLVRDGGSVNVGAASSLIRNGIITRNLFLSGYVQTSGFSQNVIVTDNIIEGGMNLEPNGQHSEGVGHQGCIFARNVVNGSISIRGNQAVIALAHANNIYAENICKGIIIDNPISQNMNSIRDLLIVNNIILGGGSGTGINIFNASKLRVIGNMIKNFVTGIIESNADYNYYLLNDVADNTNRITLAGLNSRKQLNIGDDI